MIIALFAAAVSTPAVQSPARIIDVDGQKVSYSSSVNELGERRIFGERLKDGARFEFIVERDGRVHGYVDGTPVEFDTPRVRKKG